MDNMAKFYCVVRAARIVEAAIRKNPKKWSFVFEHMVDFYGVDPLTLAIVADVPRAYNVRGNR